MQDGHFVYHLGDSIGSRCALSCSPLIVLHCEFQGLFTCVALAHYRACLSIPCILLTVRNGSAAVPHANGCWFTAARSLQYVCARCR